MQLLRLFIIISLLTYASSCGKKRKGKKGTNNGNNDNGNTGDVIHRMVGNDVQVSPYSPSGDDPVKTCDSLNCNFDSSCCWSNNQPPQDQLNWVKASGQPESAKMQSSFGTTNNPDGNYLITASETAGSAEQTAQLYSCPITCATGDVTVKLRHWQSSGVTIMVCTLTSPSDSPQNCKTLPSSSGNADTVTVPGGQNTRLAIIAKGFQAPGGSVGIIDDVNVQCTPCPDTTQATPSTPAPTPAPPPPVNPPCKEINCNFEQGNPCSYSTASSSGNAFQNWGVQSAPWQNPLTGVKKNDEGNKFAASYLKKGGEKSTMSTNANFDKDYVVCFDYYKATEGVNLRSCCDSESNCPFDTTPDVQVSHYKVWRKACMQCTGGTKQVLFISENKKGASEGAVAIDNVQLLQPSGGSPDSASQPACTSG